MTATSSMAAPTKLTSKSLRAAVLNGKGGTGKTTVITGLAATAGLLYPGRVLVVDADPRAVAWKNYQRSRKDGIDPGYACVQETDPQELRYLDQVDMRLVLIDLPGNLDREDLMGPVVAAAHMVILPTQDAPWDVQGTVETFRYVMAAADADKEARARAGQPARFPPLRCKVLINNTEPEYPQRAIEVRQAMGELRIPVFDTVIRRYRAWPNAARDGVPITQYRQPGAGGAQIDILAALREILRDYGEEVDG